MQTTAQDLVRRVVPALCLLGLACLVHAAGEAPPTDADTDAAILLKLRQAVHDADPGWTQGLKGWHPQDDRQPCSWAGINCDAQNRVARLELHEDRDKDNVAWLPLDSHPNSSAGNGTAELAAPLLPELAQLHRLRWLIFYRNFPPTVWSGIPAEWGAPGAFPRLKQLTLTSSGLAAPLPDFQPGALPALEELTLRFRQLRSTLPASWGSSLQTLPSLTSMDVELRLQGQLPADWAHGFRQLSFLCLSCTSLHADGDTVPVARETQTNASTVSDGGSLRASNGNSRQHTAADERVGDESLTGPPVELPSEWAAGFSRLEQLILNNLGIQGTIPDAWVNSGFPALQDLSLWHNMLTGTLPPELFEHHPILTSIQLGYNMLTGTLPARWGASNVEHLSLVHNRLEGTAFPPAWISPGALPAMRGLMLSGNAAITGTLPANLSWPKLTRLFLADTRVAGSIPNAWCSAPFADRYFSLGLRNTSVSPALPQCASRPARPGKLLADWEIVPTLTVNGQYPWSHSVETAAELGPSGTTTPWLHRAQFPLLCLLLLLCAFVAAAAVVHGMRYQRAKAEWLRLPQQEVQLHSQKPGSAGGGTIATHSSGTTLLTATQGQGAAGMRQLELQRLAQGHPLPYALVHCLGAVSSRGGFSHSGSFQQEATSPPRGSHSMLGPRLLFEASSRSLPAWFAKVRAWLRAPPLPPDASRASSLQSSRSVLGLQLGTTQYSLDSRHSRAAP